MKYSFFEIYESSKAMKFIYKLVAGTDSGTSVLSELRLKCS